MGGSWTTERERRLVALVAKVKNISVSKSESEEVAKLWKQEYGDDEYQPTARAARERFIAITGGTGTAKNGTPSKATNGSVFKTPTKAKAKPLVVKTPTSSAKKRKVASMSDEEEEADDDDDDDEPADVLAANLGRRASIPRSSKSATKSFKLEGSDEDADGESDTETPTANGAKNGLFDHKVGLGSGMDESDVSDYEKSARA